MLLAAGVAARGAPIAGTGADPVDRTVRTPTASGSRTAAVHHPASAGPGAPLVVVLHGGFGTGRQAEHDSGWDAVADRDGVVVAYPDGMARAWNVGPTCCGRPHTRGVDDVGYLHRLLDGLAATDGIDRRRVYAVSTTGPPVEQRYWTCPGGRSVSVALVDGAGHQWPGAPPLGPVARAVGLDEPSPALNATDWLWAHLRTAHTG